MASPSVTYTFSNSTTADGPQVSQNFTDIINGITDGTKDLSISALTCAGNVSITGSSTTIGNASSDTLTITASLASTIAVGTTYSYDIGGSTAGIRKLYLGASDSAARTAAIGAGAVSASYTFTLPAAVPTVANCVVEVDTSATASFTPRSNRATVSKTANYTATAADEVILCDASGGAFTITLPAAASNNKKVYHIKRTDQTLANAVTIDANASETIDGATTKKIQTQYESFTIVCDGSNWHVVDHFVPGACSTYTPTITGMGTVSSLTASWRRVGDSLHVNFVFTAGTTTATAVKVSLPSGLTIDTAKAAASTVVGKYNANAASWNGALFIGGSSSTDVFYGADGTAYTGGYNGNNFANGTTFGGFFCVPISGWEG